MPSVTDIQQQQQQQSSTTSNIHGKSTPPPSATTTMDPANADPITQAILILEKKQRNLGKRKERLEAFQKDEKAGKELHKDQKETLAKYPEVIGQIECVKELSEQFKKIQTDSARNQKRLLKQAADEKRQLVSQRLREYARLRYLLDHRPTTLKSEESALLDELSAVINPADGSLNSISRSIETVLSIYQGSSSTAPVKNLPGKNIQEVREVLERLLQTSEPQVSSSSSVDESEQVQSKQSDETNNNNNNTTTTTTTTDNVHLTSDNNFNEYPIQLDTRTQEVSFEQIIQNSQFLSNDSPNPSQDNDDDQTLDSKQYSQTNTGIDLNQQTLSPSSMDNQQQDNTANFVDSNEQHGDDQWHQPRANTQRGGQFSNGGGNRPFHRGRSNNYHQQWRGSRGGNGGYDNSYGGGNQRPYYDNNRGRGGSNQNYRGNRGGNYRGGNRGYNNNGNGYQKSAQYQQNNNQHQQARSAPPTSTQQPQQQ